jgi:hypothetical protein
MLKKAGDLERAFFQASKIYLGRCKAITAMYDGQIVVQVIITQIARLKILPSINSVWMNFLLWLCVLHVLQVNDSPLIISFLADADANVGAMLALAPQLRGSLRVLREAISKLSF